MKKVHVLFVCLGNICRSPMAEAVFRQLVEQRGMLEQIVVDSAGTAGWHTGKPPHEGTRDILNTRGISYEGMKARQFVSPDFKQFDYIVCMDNNNISDVRAVEGSHTHANIIRFMDLIPEDQNENVPDPYFTGNFEEVYQLVTTGCGRLLDQIQQEQHLEP